MTGDLAEIKRLLQDRIESLCRALLPDGRREGRLWVSADPVERDDAKLPALKVALDRDTGAWKNWRAPDAKGDVVALVAYVNRTDTRGALAWARDWLGLRSLSREERAAMRFAAEAAAKKREAKADKDRTDRLAGADRLFCQGEKHGDLKLAEGHARAYFSARGIPLDLVPNFGRINFRYSRETEWWRGARYESLGGGRRRKLAPGPGFPAIHASMRSRLGIVTACHCTFLDHRPGAKAPVDPAKLIFGEAKGSVIELAYGPAGRPFWQCEDPYPLIAAEGIETGLSLAIAVPEARVWAVGSISGFLEAPCDLDCVSAVFAALDNATNPTSRRQNEAALAALESRGKPVEVMKSHLGSDFNDLM